MMALMQTDLPWPVAPAISACGILARSWMTGLFVTLSTPSTTGSSIAASAQALDSMISRRSTSLRFLFGISMPTVPLPGTGARMRTASASRFIAMLFERLAIFSTRTPGAGLIS